MLTIFLYHYNYIEHPQPPTFPLPATQPPTSPLPATPPPATPLPSSPLPAQIPPQHDEDNISLSAEPVEEWLEYSADAGTQTSNPEDHIARLMDRCRISLSQNSDSSRNHSCSETQSYFHTLRNRESVTRVIETLHLPGGGFYTRFEYKVRKLYKASSIFLPLFTFFQTS